MLKKVSVALIVIVLALSCTFTCGVAWVDEIHRDQYGMVLP